MGAHQRMEGQNSRRLDRSLAQRPGSRRSHRPRSPTFLTKFLALPSPVVSPVDRRPGSDTPPAECPLHTLLPPASGQWECRLASAGAALAVSGRRSSVSSCAQPLSYPPSRGRPPGLRCHRYQVLPSPGTKVLRKRQMTATGKGM